MSTNVWKNLSITLAAVVFSASIVGSAGAASQSQVHRIVIEEALANGVVPPSLALGVARIESNFDEKALSHAGARGVMQIMPRTARVEFGTPARDLWQPRTNVRLGIAYLERLYRSYDDHWDLALSHYNGGSLKRDRRGQHLAHGYTRDYVRKVTRASRRYERDVNMQRLIARVGERGRQFASKRSTDEESFDWIYDEPGIDRGWRSFLDQADKYLDRAKKAGSQESTLREPKETAYWDRWANRVDAHEFRSAPLPGVERPSDVLRRRINETRHRFRSHL